MCRLFTVTDNGDSDSRGLLVQIPLEGESEEAVARAKAYAQDRLEEMFSERVLGKVSFEPMKLVTDRGVRCVRMEGTCKILQCVEEDPRDFVV